MMHTGVVGPHKSTIKRRKQTAKKKSKKPAEFKFRSKPKTPLREFMKMSNGEATRYDPDMHLAVRRIDPRHTYASVAARAGVSPQTVSRLFNYKVRRPVHDTLRRVLKAYGLRWTVVADDGESE